MSSIASLGQYSRIMTGKLDANASSQDGVYPFFTCAKAPLKIDTYSYDCECVLVAGNGDLNVKYYNGKFDAYQRTYIVESKDKKTLEVKYLYYFLDDYLETLRELSIGGVIKYIKLENLTKAQIPLPSLSIQQKIAEVLDRANDIIEKRKAQIEKLDLLIKSQFIEMFGDPVTNPKGWKKNCFSVTCNIITGNTPPRAISEFYGDYIEWIKTDNISEIDSSLTRANEMLSEKGFKKGRHVDKGCILMTCIAGSLSSIGNVAITDRKVSFNQQINALVPKDYNVFFLYVMLRILKKEVHKSVNMMLKGILSKGSLSQIEAVVPPIALQSQFASFFNQVESQKTLLKKSLELLEKNYKSLMQKCFNGEVF